MNSNTTTKGTTMQANLTMAQIEGEKALEVARKAAEAGRKIDFAAFCSAYWDMRRTGFHPAHARREALLEADVTGFDDLDTRSLVVA